jgi:hypothetical protein
MFGPAVVPLVLIVAIDSIVAAMIVRMVRQHLIQQNQSRCRAARPACGRRAWKPSSPFDRNSRQKCASTGPVGSA